MQIFIIKKLQQISSGPFQTKPLSVVPHKVTKQTASKIQELTTDEYFAVAGGPQIRNDSDG